LSRNSPSSPSRRIPPGPPAGTLRNTCCGSVDGFEVRAQKRGDEHCPPPGSSSGLRMQFTRWNPAPNPSSRPSQVLIIEDAQSLSTPALAAHRLIGRPQGNCYSRSPDRLPATVSHQPPADVDVDARQEILDRRVIVSQNQ